jgi:abequosyltransferase
MGENLNNKDKNIKLSVAIPTYNGSKDIREALDSIISQLNDIREEVEIVVSDNASTDETPEIMREYQGKYPFIKYFRNDENLGADRNFDLAVRRSRGEYVWLFCDDDKLKTGAMKKVLNVLKLHNNLANIFVNYSVYNGDMTQCKDERALKIYRDIHCENADAFFNSCKHSSIVASSNIILRKLWLNTNTRDYFGTRWIHFGTISSLLILNRGYASYCISKPCFILRQGEVRWRKQGTLLIYSVNLLNIIAKMPEKGYKIETVNNLLQRISKTFYSTIISAKINGLPYNMNLIDKIYKVFKFYPSFWVLDLPLLLLPNQIYNSKIIRLVYRIAKKGYKKLRGKMS